MTRNQRIVLVYWDAGPTVYTPGSFQSCPCRAVRLQPCLHPVADAGQRRRQPGRFRTPAWAVDGGGRGTSPLGTWAVERTRAPRHLIDYNRCSTQERTDASASESLAGLVPPACAMSGRPPPFPPTCCATKFTSSPALSFE